MSNVHDLIQNLLDELSPMGMCKRCLGQVLGYNDGQKLADIMESLQFEAGFRHRQETC